MAKNEYAISALGIKKSFGKVKVLEGVDLQIKRGTMLALLGPNGAGKTTMVKILSTLIKADEGQATIEGYDLSSDADKVRAIIGLTGQYAAVDEYLTGRENLFMMGRLYHLSSSESRRRTEELLQQFDLEEAAGRAAKTYSGGMRRRLDLAASLIATPSVMFLDEPTTGLDPRSRIAMWDIINDLTRQGTTILLTTQYLEEADLLADRVAVIDHGKVIAQGTADELKNQVGKERVEFSFASESELSKAAKAIGNESAKLDIERKMLSLSNDGGVHQLKQLIEKLENAKIAVEGLSLHKPTLDDVFLHLTGHEATESEEKETSTKSQKAGKK